MKAIYKYSTGEISLPQGAIVRKAGMQNGAITLWVEVDTDAPTEYRHFAAYGTGWVLPGCVLCYIDTVFDGSFVWHVYEVYNAD